MTTLARTLCTMFAVAILAAMNLHGVTQSQHAMAHIADWPAVALVEVLADHDHHGAHIHVAPDEAPDSEPETGEDGSNEGRPVGHHHHGAGDSQTAMPVTARAWSAGPTLGVSRVPPGSGPLRSGLTIDGPEYPPKRMRTVV
ncbi:MAG: hypothetical protein Q8S03_07100 [Brevundimonas sp.]|uniref:hypothetical protein n=1 Tax=Brevundimonas sp. TaxID=1871086 RepID=UPI00273595C3|nr:hypothetical protein [Brevundimonas sp.]MDP3404442.1 hypothetical protein [Brevundimonas sp.]